MSAWANRSIDCVDVETAPQQNKWRVIKLDERDSDYVVVLRHIMMFTLKMQFLWAAHWFQMGGIALMESIFLIFSPAINAVSSSVWATRRFIAAMFTVNNCQKAIFTCEHRLCWQTAHRSVFILLICFLSLFIGNTPVVTVNMEWFE